MGLALAGDKAPVSGLDRFMTGRFAWRPGVRSGRILALSGSMGAGKGIVSRILLGNCEGASVPEGLLLACRRQLIYNILPANYGLDLEGKIALIPSYTDRPHRPDELPGEYVHQTQAALKDQAEAGEFAWVIKAGGYYYATRVEDICRSLETGRVGLLSVTPATIIERLEVTWVDRREIIPVFIDSVHRVAWMKSRGGLSEDAVALREEENTRQQRLVEMAQAHGRFFPVIRNDRESDLRPVVWELAHILGEFMVAA